MRLVNLTPHGLTIYSSSGVSEVPASGSLARVRSTSDVIREIDGIPVVRQHFGQVDGLPDPEPNVAYLVSNVILTALRAHGIYRTDVMAPATGPNDGCIRNAQGHVQGVTRLAGM
jgi:hypothetical protein